MLGKIAGSTPMEQFKVNELVDSNEDFWKALVPTFRIQDASAKEAARKEAAAEGGELYKVLQKYEDYLEANGKDGFLIGSKLTIADLALTSTIGILCSGWLDGLPKSCVKPFPNVCGVVRKVLELPKIKEYYKDAEGNNTIYQLDVFNAAVASE